MSYDVDVMVVEDEIVVQMEVETTLRSLGVNSVETFSKGEQALDHLADSTVDLALMDLNLQGEIDGFETTGQILSKHDLPVVFVTAYSQESMIEKMESTGAYAYLTKPFEKDDFRKIMDGVTGNGSERPNLDRGEWIS